MATTANHDMIEEVAAGLDYSAQQLEEALSDALTVDPDDLVTELSAAPASASQAMEALDRIAELASAAAELRAHLEGLGF